LNRIREIREEKKMTQIMLSAMLNVSQGTLSNWERGVHDPDNESLLQLAKIFGCTTDYLLANSDERRIAGIDTDFIAPADDVFFRIAIEAKNSGVSPGDLQMALDLIKSAKERDEGFGERRNKQV